MWRGMSGGSMGGTSNRSVVARRRLIAVALGFGLAGMSVVLVGGRSATAQESVTSSSGLFGLWPQTAQDLPAGSDVIGVVPIEGGTDETLRVAVRFAQPFEAQDGYRASVVVGDPSAGGELRVSYLLEGGAAVSAVETLTDFGWGDAQPGVVAGSPSEGSLEFDIPRKLLSGAGDPMAPGPEALWLETDVPVEGGSRYAVSNYFAYSAFLPGALEEHPTTSAGLSTVIASSGWGAVEAYATSTPFPLQPALKAPTLAVANRGLLVTTGGPALTALDGQQARSVLDRVHLLPADLGVPSPGYLEIDRLAGSVQIYTADGAVVSDGDTAWLGTAPDPNDPGAPVTVTVDLPAVAAVLGLPEDPEQLAVSADRSIELVDGRTVVATGTGSTATAVGDFTPAPMPDVVTVEQPASAPSDSNSLLLIGGVAAIVALAVVGALVVVMRRRRGDGGDASGDRPGRASPDEVLAALERQFSEFDLPVSDSGDPEGRGKSPSP